MKYYQYCNRVKKIWYQLYTNLAYVSPTYRRVKKLRVLMINKDVRKSLARKNGNEIIIRSWNNPKLEVQYSGFVYVLFLVNALSK